MPIEGDYYDNIPEDSRNESFDLEQYDREGGKDGGIKQDDISAMRREIGNLELSLEKARRNTKIGNIGILCLLVIGVLVVVLLTFIFTDVFKCPHCSARIHSGHLEINSTNQSTPRPDTTTTQATKLGCEVGWLDAGSTNMGCLYFESITKRKPDQALRFCEERGAHLVETINQEQLDFVRMQLQVIEEQQGTAINWWGGAVDENRNGNWMWPNSKVSLGDFIWGGGDPDGGQFYFCYYARWDYKGADYPFNYDLGLICQKPHSEVARETRVNGVEASGSP